jgi:hypothetical protein
MAGPKDIQGISQNIEPETRKVLQRLKEEVQRLTGFAGDDLDKALTLRGAVALGLIDRTGKLIIGTEGPPGVQGPPGPPGESVEPDLTPPPTPAGLTVFAGITTVLVEWDAPTYTQGHGHGQTNIYAVKKDPGDATLPTFLDSVLVGTAPGALTIASLPSEPNVRWHIWIKWQSADGVESTAPEGGTNGASDTTGQDVAQLLAVLSGQITSSELSTALMARVDLIDAVATVPGSVAARVKAEADSRVAQALAMGAENLWWYGDLTAGPGVYGITQYIKSPVVGNPHRLIPGESLTVSAEIWLDSVALSAGYSSTAMLYVANSSGGWSDSVQLTRTSTAPTRLSGTIVLPPEGSMVYVGVGVWHTAVSGGGFAGAVHADKIQVERGTTATAYKQSIQGAIERVVDLESTVNGADGVVATAAALDLVQTLVTDADHGNTALAYRATSLESSVNSGTTGLAATRALLLTEYRTEVDTDTAIASAVSTVQATMDARTLCPPLEQWALNGHSIVTLTDGKVGPKALRLVGNAGYYPNSGKFIQIDRTKTYRVRFWARPSASNTGGLLYFSLWQRLADGSNGPINGGRSPYKPSGQNPTAHNTQFGTNQWGEYSYTWTASDWQTGVTQVLPEFLDNYSGAVGYWEIQGLELTDESFINAAVQVESSARVSETGHLGALYTARVQLTVGGRTVVGGFGISGTSGGTAGTTIDFGVLANKFWIGAPDDGSAAGVSDVQPFVVQTTDATVNGVSIPKGVYMDAAYIKNLSVMWARFGNLVADSIQATEISAAKLTLGDGTVGGNLKSTTYTSGSVGWIVRPDGYAEFSNVVIRGTVYASSGAIGGAIIGSSYIQSSGWVSGSGWRFNNDGTGWVGGIYMGADFVMSSNFVDLTSGFKWTAAGFIKAFGNSGDTALDTQATGTQSVLKVGGSVDLKANGNITLGGMTWDGEHLDIDGSGRFSGVLTASAVNAVNTINIAGNAVTIPMYGEYSYLSFKSVSNGAPLVMITTTSEKLYGAQQKIDVNGYVKGSGGSSLTYVAIRIYRNGYMLKEWKAASQTFGYRPTTGVIEVNEFFFDSTTDEYSTYEARLEVFAGVRDSFDTIKFKMSVSGGKK